MTDPASALAHAHRRGWAMALAATVRVTRDLDLAEECVQEAYAAALATWPRDGVPREPVAWLTTTAKRRAVDALRREQVLRTKLPLLLEPEVEEEPTMTEEEHPAVVPDEWLRLIFLCCHPALAREAQLALTLRLVCGMSTGYIARVFLTSEPTIAARLTRAKKKISIARIPFRIPSAAALPERLDAVLGVIHLLFTMGHTAPAGTGLMRTELVERALHVARTLRDLMPDEREAQGLLALILLAHARGGTRVGTDGRLLRLAEQDRSTWDQPMIDEARRLVTSALRAGGPGRYVLQAAIACAYADAPTYEATDWPRILALYDQLLAVWPSPVVALNRTVSLARVAGASRALAEVEALERDSRLGGYQYLPAIKADLLSRLGRTDEAATAYRRALELTTNDVERAFLTDRLNSVGAQSR